MGGFCLGLVDLGWESWGGGRTVGKGLGNVGFWVWRRVHGLRWRFWDGDERGDWGVLEGLVFQSVSKKTT